MNRVILVGNLGKDPECRYLQDGTAVANFSLATSESWKDRNTGEKQTKTEWHSCVVWRRLAEICSEYLTKGSKIMVEGKLQTRSWDKDDGSKGYKTEVVVQNMEMLGGGRTSGGGNQGGYSQGPPAGGQGSGGYNGPPAGQGPAPGMHYPGQGGPDDDDIPF